MTECRRCGESLQDFEVDIAKLCETAGKAHRHYVLDGNNFPQPACIVRWVRFMQGRTNQLAHDMVGDIVVSTVFLGSDHNWTGRGPPVLFETMAFAATGEPLEQWRYTSWDDAQAGHATAVRRLAHAGHVHDVDPGKLQQHQDGD
jgi:hypothetical protein